MMEASSEHSEPSTNQLLAARDASAARGSGFAVEAVDLHKTVPVGFLGKARALLDGLTLRVSEGEIHGLVGRNGAGKSTLMRVLLGVTPVQRGTVRLWGRDPADPQARTAVGYAPDIALFPPTLTPREIVRLHTALLGVSDPEGLDILNQLGLLSHADRPVRIFSKGMAQRLSLAVALLGTPRLLLLDEPMSGLDPEGRHLVRRLIRQSHASGMTILFSSHVLADVEDLCSRATIIDGGRTLTSGAVRDMTAGDGGFTLMYRCHEAIALPECHAHEARDGDGLWEARFTNAAGLEKALALLNSILHAEILTIQSNRRGFEDYLHALLSSNQAIHRSEST